MMLQVQTNLEHSIIADYFRGRLTEDREYTTYFDDGWNQHVMSSMPYREQFLETCFNAFDLWCKERYPNSYRPDQKRWDPRHSFGDWVSVWREGDHHTPHNHPRALVAGTYYPYADEHSCPTNYQSSDHSLISMADPNMPYESHYLRLKPVTGLMNLWPSWMTHQIGPQGPQEKGKERVAISFNIGRP